MAFLTALAVHDIFHNSSKLFGAMRLCTIGMLIIFYVVLIQIKFSGEEHVLNWPTTCLVEGLIIQFCYLSAMCWLNAMSLVIWKNFRKIRASLSNNGRLCRPLQGFKDSRFKWCALYAWGLPLIIFGVTLTMQLLPDVPDWAIKPDIGARRCFLEDYWATLVYFHVVSIPVLVGNILFFIFFAHNLMCGIWSNRSGDPVLRDQSSAHIQAVVKMFFALGLTWVCDFISWILEWHYGRNNPDTFRFSSIFKVLNALQGFIMFTVIVVDGNFFRKCCHASKSEPLRSLQTQVTRTTLLKSDFNTHLNRDEEFPMENKKNTSLAAKK